MYSADELLLIPDYVSMAVHEIARTKGFEEVELIWKPGMNVGDGFCGRIFRVIVREAAADDKKMILIAKLPPEQKEYRKLAMSMFNREARMYNEILPALKMFQQKMNVSEESAFLAFPNCHLAHYDGERDEAFIILDDLRESGFSLENKYEVIGLEHAKMSIQAIARYHATSIAMKHKDPVLFTPSKGLGDVFKDLFPDSVLIQMTAGNVANAMKTLQKDTDVVYREKLEWFRDNIIEISDSIWNAEPLAVPIHGDCWTNNFMFKYEDGRPKEIIILDWQQSRYVSPVIDFCHFMFVCTDKAFRDQHYDEFIELYFETVQVHLHLLDCDGCKLFPYDEFRNHFMKFGKYVLLVAMFALPIICTPNEDLPDMSELMEKMRDDPESENTFIDAFKSENNVNYASRMGDAVRDLVDYGYL